MIIKQATFLISNTDFKKCPSPDKPEYAFIGRSNVGKSSLINMLTGSNNLAKVSAKPGKTRLINHFLINKEWYLVDLPGYGWAKISKSEREKWNIMVKDYLLKRENLQCIFVLIDSRIDPQEIDIEFIEWLGLNQVPFVLIFTKTDKQTQSKVQKTLAQFKNTLKEKWEELPEIFLTSSETKIGRDAILSFIDNVNKNYKEEQPQQ